MLSGPYQSQCSDQKQIQPGCEVQKPLLSTQLLIVTFMKSSLQRKGSKTIVLRPAAVGSCVINADSQVPFTPTESESLGVGPLSICVIQIHPEVGEPLIERNTPHVVARKVYQLFGHFLMASFFREYFAIKIPF